MNLFRPCAIALLSAAALSVSEARGKREPVFATSARDLALSNSIARLASTISPEEAQLVAHIAYTTGRELTREWEVVWPPGLQNMLVHSGEKRGGLCFQWATELLLRLDARKLQTIDVHWAESFAGTASEHNVIVVTAKGQPFAHGILLDNWRYGGRLVWGPVAADPHYEWQENKVAAEARLQRFRPRAAAAFPVPRKALPVRQRASQSLASEKRRSN